MSGTSYCSRLLRRLVADPSSMCSRGDIMVALDLGLLITPGQDITPPTTQDSSLRTSLKTDLDGALHFIYALYLA